MKKYKVKLIETYAFYFEVEANNRVEAEEKAKEYVAKSSIKLINSLSVLQIGFLKLFPKRKEN